MIAALLLGRKGSIGFPGKNLYPLLGRPLMAYPLLAALHARQVDEVYVSTDDERIMKVSEDAGAKIIIRPPELAKKRAVGKYAYVHYIDPYEKSGDVSVITTKTTMTMNDQ